MVEGGGLENRFPVIPERGFESLSLRQLTNYFQTLIKEEISSINLWRFQSKIFLINPI